jgi:Rieske 2Fe-2S family protein
MTDAMQDQEASAYTHGYALPQRLYLDETQYRRDVAWLREKLWLFVDHESGIPRTGDFFLYEFDKTNIIIIRDREGRVRAHYNVCRHRGSRICTESSGTKQSLICPYHAWNFGLDGRLRAAPFMLTDFDKEQHGLIPCHARVHGGLIFLSLARVPPDFAAFAGSFTRELEFHDMPHAKVIKRASFAAAANWKLVVQNNLECYHCGPAHPTYWAAHPGTLAPRSEAEEYDARLWEPTDDRQARKVRWFEAMQRTEDSLYVQSWGRHVIGGNFVTESVGGGPVAPLMGQAAYDGGQTQGTFSPLTTFVMNPDYAIIYNFIPRSVRHTDIDAFWLVKDTAVEGVDYDTSRVAAVWEATLREDKELVQNNQLGVESAGYRPGPYSRMEIGVSEFDRRYVRYVVESDV